MDAGVAAGEAENPAAFVCACEASEVVVGCILIGRWTTNPGSIKKSVNSSVTKIGRLDFR